MRVYHNLKLEFRVKTSLKKKQRYDIQKKKKKHSKKHILTHIWSNVSERGPKKVHSDLKHKFDLHFLHFKHAEAFGTQ